MFFNETLISSAINSERIRSALETLFQNRLDTMSEGVTVVPVAPAPPVPPNEDVRMDQLEKYRVLDSEMEQSFDRISELAIGMFKVPIALISLVDTDRQWFKSCYGLDVRETSRKDAFCAHAIMPDAPSVFIVPDATDDPRFANNPLVLNHPHIRFYAGAPLISNGQKLGTVCIIDSEPRHDFTISDSVNLQARAVPADAPRARVFSVSPAGGWSSGDGNPGCVRCSMCVDDRPPRPLLSPTRLAEPRRAHRRPAHRPALLN